MTAGDSQDARYRAAAAEFGPALERLARAYEADHDPRRDLLQDIHLALWRSFAAFDARCSLRTWVYRVAHNVAASHAARSRRARRLALSDLAELSQTAGVDDPETAAGESQALARLTRLIQALDAPDRQVVVLYLEGLDGAAIGEVTGLSPGAVAIRIHRLKALLARQFQQGGHRVDRAS